MAAADAGDGGRVGGGGGLAAEGRGGGMGGRLILQIGFSLGRWSRMIIGVSAFHKRVHIKRSWSVDRDNICHVVAVRGRQRARTVPPRIQDNRSVLCTRPYA